MLRRMQTTDGFEPPAAAFEDGSGAVRTWYAALARRQATEHDWRGVMRQRLDALERAAAAARGIVLDA
jgi:hypothetical protein